LKYCGWGFVFPLWEMFTNLNTKSRRYLLKTY
jgi:hypothetical protein